MNRNTPHSCDTRPTPQAMHIAASRNSPHVFISHAGEQKREFVDMLRVSLQDQHKLDVFVDEWSLCPNDDASSVIEQNLRTAAIAVVVLSSEFVAKKDPMEEVRQIVQQRDAGSGQRLCILLHDISYEECSQSVLPEYAADLKKLLGITALRGDQVGNFRGVGAQLAVATVIDMLKEIGQLPPGYGDSAVNQLPRPAGLLGRDEALHNVVKTLKYERLVIIVGGPGEGKSVLAAAAAHSMSDDKLLPGGAFAVDLATATTDGGKAALSQHIADQLMAASSRLEGAWQLATKAEWKQLLLWLRTSAKPMLIVLENAEHAMRDGIANKALLQLIDELHTCPSISIAVTSRIKPMSKYLLELPLLDIDSAVSLLRRHSGAQAATLQAEHATKLVQSCGCNALLLQVLGAMIASRRCQVKALLEAAQAGGPLSVLQDSRQGGPRDHEDIAKAFAWIAGHLLPKQLHALSSLALFRGSFSEEAAQAVLQPNATEATTLLQDLADACLLSLTGTARLTDTHLQLPAIAAADSPQRWTLHPIVWDFAEQLRCAQSSDRQIAGLWAFMRIMLVQGAKLDALRPGRGVHTEDQLTEALQLLADEVANFGALATQLGQSPLVGKSAVELPDQPAELTVEKLRRLACCLVAFDRHALAARLFERLAAVSTDALGLDHPATLHVRGDLGYTIGVLGRRAEAAKILKTVLHQRTLLPGPENGQDGRLTLCTSSDLASQLENMGDHAEAEKIYRRIISIRQRELSAEHEYTLCAQQGLAYNLGLQGRHAESAELHAQLVKKMQECPDMGPLHLHTLLSMFHHAEQLSMLGQHEEAAKLHKHTFDIRRQPKVLGPVHAHTLDSMHSLARERGHLNDHAMAATLYEKVLVLRQRSHGTAYEKRLESAKGLIEQLILDKQLRRANDMQQQLEDGKL